MALGVDDETKARILSLKRTMLCEAKVGSYELIISRTGYTGEKMAFELFVHPDFADSLFNSLLDAGMPYGLKPVGLGARDSLRTEAGLPLYGHEMGMGSGHCGEKDLGVAEAGFGSYVKTYKPWFIGREPYLKNLASQKGVIVRFRFIDKGVRMAHNGDPVVDRKGRTIGFVTSCAIDQDGYLTGLAFVDLRNSEEGETIFIFQGANNTPGKAISSLKINEKVVLPTQATIISRFPK
jgi:glycine hydroxymethyltransferase